MGNLLIEAARALTKDCTYLSPLARYRTGEAVGVLGGTGLVAPAKAAKEHLFALAPRRLGVRWEHLPAVVSVYEAERMQGTAIVASSDDDTLFDGARVGPPLEYQRVEVRDPFTRKLRVIDKHLERAGPNHLFARPAQSDPGFSALFEEGPPEVRAWLDAHGFHSDWRNSDLLDNPTCAEFFEWWRSRNHDFDDYFIGNEDAVQVGGWPQWYPEGRGKGAAAQKLEFVASWFWTMQASTQLYWSSRTRKLEAFVAYGT